MSKIVIATEKIWDFYNEHQGIMEEEDVMYRVAESETGDLRLYISSDHGAPVFMVYQRTSPSQNELEDEDDNDTGLYGFKCIAEECAIPRKSGKSLKSETEEVMRCLLEDYIFYAETESAEECIDKIKEREEELSDAISEFLTVALYKSDDKNVVYDEEILEDVLRLLYEKHGVNIYRPMILEDEEGEFYEDYPYPHLIYKLSDPVAGE